MTHGSLAEPVVAEGVEEQWQNWFGPWGDLAPCYDDWCRYLVWGMGAIHCLAMQVPAA